MLRITRALISVWDKEGLIPFAKNLAAYGIEIISTGGTAKALQEAGVKVIPLSQITGFPEILDGRVKTLHPAIHAGLLARKNDFSHIQQIKKLKIQPIDLIVVNLYPFAQATKNARISLAQAIEYIDIGGVALLRAGAKNYEGVAVLSDPAQYAAFSQELCTQKGAVSLTTRESLAAKAFTITSTYDACISRFLGARFSSHSQTHPLEENYMLFAGEKIQDLRYGENPHQKGAFYKDVFSSYGIGAAKVLWGKELSFNNILDLDAAYTLVSEFQTPSACIIKHTNPCGVASALRLDIAFRNAYATDPLSAFGGIIGLNKKVDLRTAHAIEKAGFMECIIAPGYEKKALEILKKRKNLRILALLPTPARLSQEFDVKKVRGGFLVQELDNVKKGNVTLTPVTRKIPSPAQRKTLLFAWTICQHVKSNAIVLAKGTQAVGIGPGQTSRIDSLKTAGEKAGNRTKGAVLASDGFFPKRDTVEHAHKAGITAIIQPGGSIKDEEIIQAADRLGIAMVFTGVRHFKH